MRIETRSEVLEVDDLGRTRRVRQYNDTARSDDDLCIETTYATPMSLFVRLYSLPATRRVTSCGMDLPTNLTFEYWEYNRLPVGTVSFGQLTSHVTESFSTDTGQSQGTIRQFEASHDNVGNPTYIVSAREDGATRAVDIAYDEFRLVPRKITINAAGTPEFTTELGLDALTLETVAEHELNGTIWMRSRDGYGRETQLKVEPPSSSGAAGGLVSHTTYTGFTEGEVGARSVTTVSFATPNGSDGRATVIDLDELGRSWRSKSALGEDYDDREMIVMRRWDDQGRLHFESDPFPSTQNAATAYGTTYHFDREGTLRCSIRGRGAQPLVEVTNLAQEVLPTCYTRTFDNHQLTVSIRSPDSNALGTSQSGVARRETMTAIGRVLRRETVHNGQLQERSSHEHDALGHLTALHRYRAPGTSQEAVTWRWRYDSMGRVLSAMEPETATRNMTYSNWGDLVLIDWKDISGATPVKVKLHRVFDALGRLTFSVDSRDDQEVSGTSYKYRYDVADENSPISSEFSLGRLTSTKSDLGSVHVSYDAYGRVDERAFVSVKGEHYFESRSRNFDGTPSLIEYRLSDTGYTPEQYRYRYDSAQRLSSVEFVQDNALLYAVNGIDDFGRVRKAVYGKDAQIIVNNEYAEEGRRLPMWSGVDLVSGKSHVTEYAAYDAVGRELTRREHEHGALARIITSTFDSIGRLGHQIVQPSGASYETHSPNYDALGNITELTSTTPSLDVKLAYGTVDRDRVCRIGYASSPGTGPCNVLYDGSGNIVEYPTRENGIRQLTFYPSGAIEQVRDQTGTATFRYDGSGEIFEVDISGKEKRRDLHFGPFIHRTNGDEAYVVRNVPGADGIVASRRGKDGPWVFPFAESRGTRVSASSESDEFVQTVEYRPFGEASSKGADPSKREYTTDQWNGGDLLASFQLVHLGARMYDPVIGRFLSRDPLVIPRTASVTNPYAFAWNDPVNFSDPSGLDCESPTGQCDSDWGWVAGAVAQGIQRIRGFFGGDDQPPSPKLVQPGGLATGWYVYAGKSSKSSTLGDIGSWFADVHWKYNPLSPAPMVSLLRGDPKTAAVLSLRRLAMGASVANPGVGVAIGAALEGTATAIETGSADQAFSAGFQFAIYSYLGNAIFRSAGSWLNSVGDDVSKGVQDGFRSYADDVARQATLTGRNIPYETALAGGLHRGTLANYTSRTLREVQRAVRGYRRQVALHRGYIANPTSKIPHWASLSASQRTYYIGKWWNDLERNATLSRVMEGLEGAMSGI